MLGKLKSEIIHAGHIQCIGAILIVLSTSIFFDLPISWNLLLLVYLLFYTFYLFNRAMELPIDLITNPERTRHLLLYKSKIPIILFCVVILIGLLLILINNYEIIFFTLTFLLFGILYTLKAKKLTRQIPLFKNFYVALCFGLLVFYPFIYNNATIGRYARLLFLVIILKVVLIQILADFKDLNSDKLEKLKTMPVLIGKEKTLIFLFFLSLLFSAFFALIHPLFFLTFIYNFIIYKIAIKNERLAYFLSTGEFALWLLLTYVSKII